MDRRVRVLTKKEQEAIKRIYVEERVGIAQTAKALRISMPVVEKFLVHNGLLRSKEEIVEIRSNNNKVKFDETDVIQMVEMFNEGKTIYFIKKYFNTSTIPVIRALIVQGGISKTKFKHWKMAPVIALLKTL